jgi:hypothetical protein
VSAGALADRTIREREVAATVLDEGATGGFSEGLETTTSAGRT